MLTQAHTALTPARRLLDESAAALGRLNAQLDDLQLPLYQLSHLATQVAAAEQLLAHAQNIHSQATTAARLTVGLAQRYAAEAANTVRQTLTFREAMFGLAAGAAEAAYAAPEVSNFLRSALSGADTADLARLIAQTGGAGANGLSAEEEAIQQTFRRYASEQVAPLAESIHRRDLLIPDTMLDELVEMGVFGLTIPTKYGGYQDDDAPNHMAMVLVADELSRASFGSAGSVGTRPELLAKALLKGGTEAQKRKWLPQIAHGMRQAAVAITEADYGSNVAGLRTAATKTEGGWLLNGSKMWSTFAGRADIIMVLARTNPDISLGHRGLTLFIVEKPISYKKAFAFEQPNGGRISGRAIPTIGYRGMHSFELVFENYFVPNENVIGEATGVGQGFYLQMHGFGGSRLQTAGRALGVMAAAFGAALRYTQEREIFGRPLFKMGLTQHKLVQMAQTLQAARRLTYFAAAELDKGTGDVPSAMAKLFTARAAEWLTREAQQLHGGMGYAEEFAVSRHFSDARVLAIFEGAEEVLALRLIGRALLNSSSEAGDFS